MPTQPCQPICIHLVVHVHPATLTWLLWVLLDPSKNITSRQESRLIQSHTKKERSFFWITRICGSLSVSPPFLLFYVTPHLFHFSLGFSWGSRMTQSGQVSMDGWAQSGEHSWVNATGWMWGSGCNQQWLNTARSLILTGSRFISHSSFWGQ